MRDASKTPIIYNPEKYVDYQSIESGSILNIELNHLATHSLLETHQGV
jgi:hypothetical protein